jgi:hypothetical protein
MRQAVARGAAEIQTAGGPTMIDRTVHDCDMIDYDTPRHAIWRPTKRATRPHNAR